MRRAPDTPRWVLSGGKGVYAAPDDPIARARLIVVTDLDGNTREASLRMAIEITEPELRAIHGDKIKWVTRCSWSRRDQRVLARRQECYGALVLQDQIWHDAPRDLVAAAVLTGIRELGIRILGWSTGARRFQARVETARAGGAALPDFSDAGLTARLETWLLPGLSDCQNVDDLKSLDLLNLLRQSLDWADLQKIDRLAPSHFVTPLGHRLAIDYNDEAPAIAVRLQEMLGVNTHPTIGQDHRPLRVTLLSPAGRPVQTTQDLPGFWISSYPDVRKDMRGRYPKHAWPEDPVAATPSSGMKRRR